MVKNSLPQKKKKIVAKKELLASAPPRDLENLKNMDLTRGGNSKDIHIVQLFEIIQ